jgi:hypothetical protein
MWRLFRHYNVHQSYDGVASSVGEAANMKLDEITVSGGLRLAALNEIIQKRQWRFAYQLKALTQLEEFQKLLKSEVPPIDPKSEGHHSAKKWKRHLRALEEYKVLKWRAKSAIRAFEKYFAVMKSDGKTARAIFNGKILSQFFLPPPTTNLPDIADVLAELSQCSYLIIGDWRHYFHQFGLADQVQNYFGLELGSDTWVYQVLPMGWSWSPRLAQSASMAILLEAASRAKLINPRDYQELENPPSMIKMRGGAVTVWYDNVLGMFQDPNSRDRFYEELTALCAEAQLNVIWKNLRKFNRNDMPESREKKAKEAATAEERDELALPEYLGLMIANAQSKRHADGDSAKLKWKHHPDRLARWTDLTSSSTYKTLRDIARSVGCILWDAVISLRPLCDESKPLELLSKAGKAVQKCNWDATLAGVVSEEEVEYLRSRLDIIVNASTYHTVRLQTGASVINCASDACTEGFGYVVWDGTTVDTNISQLRQIKFPERLSTAHIFLKEMYAAMQCIEAIARSHHGVRIRLAEDNTAVLWSLRNGYSHNRHANIMIQRIHRTLEQSNCTLDVFPVPSACNAADAPSRNKPYDETADAACRKVLDDFAKSLGRIAVSDKNGPAFNGRLRHEEPDDNVWQNEDLADVESLLNGSCEDA